MIVPGSILALFYIVVAVQNVKVVVLQGNMRPKNRSSDKDSQGDASLRHFGNIHHQHALWFLLVHILFVALKPYLCSLLDPAADQALPVL